MTKKQLSGPNRWLVEQGQLINYGRLTFHVRGGQPDLHRPCSKLITLKLSGGANGPRPEAAHEDFELRHEQVALIEQLKVLPDGTRVRVKFAHGLPGSSFDILEEQQAA
ncbi:MAG: hypothetical protein J5J06_13790 [Phycisphaerae bacterium]|nr:hypothetical protein [Phycisphaerae bacterium]